MGTRGNVLIKRGGVCGLIPIRWIEGPMACLTEGPVAFDRAVQRACDEDPPGVPLYHDVQCEASALVDHDARSLLFFSDTDWYELRVRRRFAAEVERAWPGWRSRWASRGFEEIVAAAGVRESDLGVDLFSDWEPLDDLASLDSIGHAGVITVLDAGRRRHIAVGRDPTLVDLNAITFEGWWRNQMDRATDALVLLGEDPEGGFVIDLEARRLATWSHSQASWRGFVDRWPGWAVTHWGDQFETHLAAGQGSLVFPERSEEEVGDVLRRLLERGGVDGCA